MLKLLVAVDGSENSGRVVEYLIEKSGLYKEPAEVHLLNVQMPLAGVNVKMFISKDTLNEYYHDEGMAARGECDHHRIVTAEYDIDRDNLHERDPEQRVVECDFYDCLCLSGIGAGVRVKKVRQVYQCRGRSQSHRR